MALSTHEAIIKDKERHKRLLENYEAYLELQKANGKLKDLDSLAYLQKSQSPQRTIFTFLSEKDAIDFFEEQAKQGTSFFVVQLDSNGEYSGDYMFSSGNGKMVQGNLNPELINQLVEHEKEFVNSPEKAKALMNALEYNDEDALNDLLQEFSSTPRPDSMRPGGM